MNSPISIADFDKNFLGIRTKNILTDQLKAIFLAEGSYLRLKIQQDTVETLISKAASLYHYNPYHNLQHAVDVVNSIYWLLTQKRLTEILQDSHRFLLMVAGLMHDLDHPGKSNRWEVLNKTERCLRYDGVSVLENHSLSLSKDIFLEIGLVQQMEQSIGSEWEPFFDEIILSTDFERHAVFVKNFSKWLKESPSNINPRENEQILQVSRAIIKAADLGNVCKPFFQAVRWAKRVMLENWDQWIASRKLGVTDNVINNPTETNFNEVQIGFINFLARDLFVLLGQIEPAVEEQLVVAIDRNIEYYHISAKELPMWITYNTTFFAEK